MGTAVVHTEAHPQHIGFPLGQCAQNLFQGLGKQCVGGGVGRAGGALVLYEGADGGVLSAMILGEKSGLDAEVKSLYQKAGISHILAISGLHVSFLGMGLYRILRHRLRRSYWMSATITSSVMISYAIMTGNGVSTLRAVGMLCVYLIADMLGQNYDMLSALGVMIFVLLWKNPFLIGYSGFVFSIAAVLGVGAGQFYSGVT